MRIEVKEFRQSIVADAVAAGVSQLSAEWAHGRR